MAGPAYQWGEWRFEPTEGRLLKRGVAVALPAKTLDLLTTLLNRAPRLVTKEEILQAVWADAVVEEGNIAFHVAALRKAIDENEGPSAIETVRGKGYRFVKELSIYELPPTEGLRREAIERAMASAAVKPEAAAPLPAYDAAAAREPGAPASRDASRVSTRWLIAAMAIVAVAALTAIAWPRLRPKPIVIAIDQFTIVNPPPGQENFPDGLRTYVMTKLQVAGIATADREAASVVLSGQLRPMNGGFEVTVQLTRLEDGARVWDWKFDVASDAEKPIGDQDDARSRLQGVISGLTADGLVRYLSLSGAAPVTR